MKTLDEYSKEIKALDKQRKKIKDELKQTYKKLTDKQVQNRQAKIIKIDKQMDALNKRYEAAATRQNERNEKTQKRQKGDNPFYQESRFNYGTKSKSGVVSKRK